MAIVRKYTSKTLDRVSGSSEFHDVRNDNTGISNVSAKVSGSVVHLPGGTQFRAATNYARYNGVISPLSPQVTVTKTVAGSPQTARSNSGGFRSDLIHENIDFNSPSGAQLDSNSYPVIPSGMRNEAVTKALLKIADQKVNLGENLATFGMTVRLFANAGGLLAGALASAYRNRSIRPYLMQSYRQLLANGVSRSIANRYLEYVYGWKPLVQDVFALHKLCTTEGNKTLLLSGKGSSTSEAQGAVKTFQDGSFNSTTVLGPTREQVTVRCKLYSRIDPQWQGLRALNQLGLLNPASLAWELVPWSFVVDWLVPIGPVLSALTASAGLVFVDGTVSVRTRVDGPYKHWYKAYDNNIIFQNTPATGSVHVDGYKRDHLSDWPLPGVWIVSDPLKGDRPFKAVALAISNVGGMRKSRMG